MTPRPVCVRTWQLEEGLRLRAFTGEGWCKPCGRIMPTLMAYVEGAPMVERYEAGMHLVKEKYQKEELLVPHFQLWQGDKLLRELQTSHPGLFEDFVKGA